MRNLFIAATLLVGAASFMDLSKMQGRESETEALHEETFKIRESLRTMLGKYPKSQYADVYKNYFQDNFGPGHILADTAAAARYIMEELNSATAFDGPAYEPTGFHGNFYRVNLSLLKDGIIDFPTYFSAFTRSVAGITPPSNDEWHREWQMIDSVIKSEGLHFPDEDNDRHMVEERLASGNFAVHHSERFNNAYQLHYRIISRDIFLNEILPLLDKR